MATRAGNTNWKHTCGAEPELEAVAVVGDMQDLNHHGAGVLAMAHSLSLALSDLEEVIAILPI